MHFYALSYDLQQLSSNQQIDCSTVEANILINRMPCQREVRSLAFSAGAFDLEPNSDTAWNQRTASCEQDQHLSKSLEVELFYRKSFIAINARLELRNNKFEYEFKYEKSKAI